LPIIAGAVRLLHHDTHRHDAGSMSFGNLAEADGRLEIGWSWLGRDSAARGQSVAKYLLLEHAFERLNAERVEFKTDRLNEQARRGLRNMAPSRGTLRSYNRCGRPRRTRVLQRAQGGMRTSSRNSHQRKVSPPDGR